MAAHRTVLLVAAGAATILALAGCTPTPAPSGTSTTTASQSATSVPTASATSTATSVPTPTGSAIGPSGSTLTADAIQNLEDSISSGNTAALEGYFGPSVHVVITNGTDTHMSPSDAVGATDYVVDLNATWNWSLPASTLASYRAGAYAAMFPTDAVIGKSSSGHIVAFTAVGNSVTGLLLCIDEPLLQ